jgi:DNA-binding NarL/FixJ family response regulator
MENNLIKISIIEDNKYMREGWESVLDLQDDFVVIGAYESCEDAFAARDIGRSDVVLMDIELPGITGIEGVKRLVDEYPRMNIIMATVFDDNNHVFDALCAGAIGYLLKKTEQDELCNSIRLAMQGGSPMTPEIARKVIRFIQPKQPGNTGIDLSEREKEILRELATGKSYQAKPYPEYVKSIIKAGGLMSAVAERVIQGASRNKGYRVVEYPDTLGHFFAKYEPLRG